MTIFGKYINHTKTVSQVQEKLLSLASCIIYISLIVKELYRENLVKHINFYIARYVFDTLAYNVEARGVSRSITSLE